jgi:hypothetical protein
VKLYTGLKDTYSISRAKARDALIKKQEVKR